MAGPQLPIEVPYPEQDQVDGWSDNSNRSENVGKGLSGTHRGRGRKSLTDQAQPPQGHMRKNEDA
jgi:hypothetical protein